MLPDGRIKNWRAHGHCKRCENEGLIEGGSSTLLISRPGRAPMTYTYEGQAPCPSCAKGYRIEFAISVKRNREGVVLDEWYADPAGGPWGKDGFWRGRGIAEVLG